MYTGLIQSVGQILENRASPAGRRLVVASPADLLAHPPPTAGESINLDGCCLSLVAHAPHPPHPPHPAPAGGWALAFDATHQTLANTTLGTLAPGTPVHLERSCTPSTLLGGHLVQGHVDGVARVVDVVREPQWRVRIAPPAHLMPYVTPRGSIAVAGVSLTIAELSVPEGWFEVALIPDTLDRTNLGRLVPGDGVNVECDGLVKALIHWHRHYGTVAENTPNGPKA